MKISMIANFQLYFKVPETGDYKLLTKEDFDSLSPGGFEFVVDGKTIPFDWDAQSTSEENGVFHYESGYGPFFNDFEIPDYWEEEYKEAGIKHEDITAEFLSKASEIRDFYINFALKGEDGDTGIGSNEDPNTDFFLKLINIAFEERETGRMFNVSDEVIKTFNNGGKVEAPFVVVNEDGTPYNPPENPLKEKWAKLYPPVSMPQYSQVCDGYSCQWCGRCPNGSYWKVPEEDLEVWNKYKKELEEYNRKHNSSLFKEEEK